MKLCVLVSNYKDESMNRKNAAEWISFHMPGSSGGQRSQWLWWALWPHGSIWKMIFIHFPFPCCPSSISSWSRGHPELLLEHRIRLSFWIKIPLVFGLQTFFPRSTGDECYYNIAQTLSVFRAVSITLWWSVGEFCKHLFVLGEQTPAPTALRPVYNQCSFSDQITSTNPTESFLRYSFNTGVTFLSQLCYWNIAKMRIWCKKSSPFSACFFY